MSDDSYSCSYQDGMISENGVSRQATETEKAEMERYAQDLERYNSQMSNRMMSDMDRMFSQRIFPSLEDLETHLCNDHFKVFLYECGRCPYAKFPTECTLVDHYAETHDLKDNMEIKYTLDEPTREIRRKIQECLIKSATNPQPYPLTNKLRKSDTRLSASTASVIEVDITENEDDEEVGGSKSAISRISGAKRNSGTGKPSREETPKSSTTSETNRVTRQSRKNARPEKLEMPLMTPRRTPRRLSSTLAEEKIHSYHEMDEKILNSLRSSRGQTRAEKVQNRSRKST
ncbi:Zinc finger putative Transcription Factor family [Ditylenchus destructor]|uniref:Zinc finger putative Transcription Factor family n=1 Tax=Ditylenchus destructor TaxID=166010 RepID=A0AAD4NGR4_9BILA|nr:Zinc finger putative Transcription Factor family [Ditylenchus destructor]